MREKSVEVFTVESIIKNVVRIEKKFQPATSVPQISNKSNKSSMRNFQLSFGLFTNNKRKNQCSPKRVKNVSFQKCFSNTALLFLHFFYHPFSSSDFRLIGFIN